MWVCLHSSISLCDFWPTTKQSIKGKGTAESNHVYLNQHHIVMYTHKQSQLTFQPTLLHNMPTQYIIHCISQMNFAIFIYAQCNKLTRRFAIFHNYSEEHSLNIRSLHTFIYNVWLFVDTYVCKNLYWRKYFLCFTGQNLSVSDVLKPMQPPSPANK